MLKQYAVPLLFSAAIHGVVLWLVWHNWASTPPAMEVAPVHYIDAQLVQLEDRPSKKAAAPRPAKKIDLTARRERQEQQAREREAQRQAQRKHEQQLAQQRAAEQQRQQAVLAAEKAQQQRERIARQQRLQQQLEQALTEEHGQLQEEALASEAQSYIAKIRQRVEAKWNRPPSARKGMRCILNIQLVPTGRIVRVDVVKSSGHEAFDRSAVQAVKQVEVFPEIKTMSADAFERYYRRFNFLFNPQDLRL